MSKNSNVKKVSAPKNDIRGSLPVAVKGGTSHKPIWLIDGKEYRFVASVRKDGLKADGSKVRLGKRIFAKYEAATTSPTVPGGKLQFVGVFAAAS